MQPARYHSTAVAWAWGAAVSSVMAAYYWLFYLPPRLVGSNDPDRFYHLALSKLMATEGLLRRLPQVEDLSWNRYFPDKEFLFHVVTGAAHWTGGQVAVYMVVPVLGIGIVVSLYAPLSRVLIPWRAAIFTLSALMLCPVMIFRITLLRPHLLAILFFSLLLSGILTRRAWLAGLAAAGFALSYHAFYIPALVIIVAALLEPGGQPFRVRPWVWATVGLALGVVLNPYFPSNLIMSWAVVKIALGIGLPPGLRSGNELLPISWREYVGYFGFLPAAALGSGILAWVRRLKLTGESFGFWFLFALSLLLTLLSFKSARATEYAVPSTMLLMGYALSIADRLRWFFLTILLLALTQGAASATYYREIWNVPQGTSTGWYLTSSELIPSQSEGMKVFNCQWEAGSYLLFSRPELRFVDLLEPALLWQASPEKYIARERLIRGLETEPHRLLRDAFGADYVLCGSQPLIRQMQADSRHFTPIVGSEAMGPLRLFKVVPSAP